MSLLANLKPAAGSRRNIKRLGRGDGSGHGGTLTRGHKGQKSRSGNGKIMRGFEGGQMPLHRRSPKWGFTNPSKIEYSTVNLGLLSERFADGEEVSLETLLAKRLVRKKNGPVKVLGNGKLTKALKLKVHAVSGSAQKAIEAAKGSVELLSKKGSEQK